MNKNTPIMDRGGNMHKECLLEEIYENNTIHNLLEFDLLLESAQIISEIAPLVALAAPIVKSGLISVLGNEFVQRSGAAELIHNTIDKGMKLIYDYVGTEKEQTLRLIFDDDQFKWSLEAPKNIWNNFNQLCNNYGLDLSESDKAAALFIKLSQKYSTAKALNIIHQNNIPQNIKSNIDTLYTTMIDKKPSFNSGSFYNIKNTGQNHESIKGETETITTNSENNTGTTNGSTSSSTPWYQNKWLWIAVAGIAAATTIAAWFYMRRKTLEKVINDPKMSVMEKIRYCQNGIEDAKKRLANAKNLADKEKIESQLKAHEDALKKLQN